MAREPYVLVAYSSKYGSTREVAERIGSRLGDRGCRVDVLPVSQVGNTDAYDAVAVGSPVYGAAWVPEAAEFVRGHSHALTGCPVWLFSAGPLSGQRGLIGAMTTGAEPDDVAGLRRVMHLQGHQMFGGAVHKDRLSLVVRVIFRGLGGCYGDFRDWPAIDSWADQVGRTVRERSWREGSTVDQLPSTAVAPVPPPSHQPVTENTDDDATGQSG